MLTFPSLLLAVMALAGALAGGGLVLTPRRPRSSPTPALPTPHPSLSLTATYTHTHTPTAANHTEPGHRSWHLPWRLPPITEPTTCFQDLHFSWTAIESWSYFYSCEITGTSWPQSDNKLSVEDRSAQPGLRPRLSWFLSIQRPCASNAWCCCRHRVVPL